MNILFTFFHPYLFKKSYNVKLNNIFHFSPWEIFFYQSRPNGNNLFLRSRRNGSRPNGNDKNVDEMRQTGMLPSVYCN